MRKKEEYDKNRIIIEFLEENPDIHTNVQEFLARNFSEVCFLSKIVEFNQANYVYKHNKNK